MFQPGREDRTGLAKHFLYLDMAISDGRAGSGSTPVSPHVHIRAVLDGKEPQERATWNALCLADFGDSGVAFIAKPQIPPRNLNWASRGRWVHLAKIAFEKYFLRKVKKGVSEPIYEKVILEFIGLKKLRES